MRSSTGSDPICHKLRNCLHNIELSVALLDRRLAGNADLRPLEKIRAEVQAAATLVQQLEEEQAPD